MERQKERPKEAYKELKKKEEKELEELKKELATLRDLKRKKELMEKSAAQEGVSLPEKEEVILEDVNTESIDNVEERLNKIEGFLTSQLGEADQSTYEQHAKEIELELQSLEQEIIGEKGVIEKELNAYGKLLKDYPWIEEQRYKFMYTIPNKKKNRSDYESWKTEWAKVFFNYAKYSIIHVVYLRKVNSEKPFSSFENRETSIKKIAEELIKQDIASWSSKKKDKLRIYWKTLDLWSDEIYEWAIDLGKLEPIMIYEIREAKNKDFNNLPLEDLEKIFKILAKERRAEIFKMDDGQLAFKINLE